MFTGYVCTNWVVGIYAVSPITYSGCPENGKRPHSIQSRRETSRQDTSALDVLWNTAIMVVHATLVLVLQYINYSDLTYMIGEFARIAAGEKS